MFFVVWSFCVELASRWDCEFSLFVVLACLRIECGAWYSMGPLFVAEDLFFLWLLCSLILACRIWFAACVVVCVLVPAQCLLVCSAYAASFSACCSVFVRAVCRFARMTACVENYLLCCCPCFLTYFFNLYHHNRTGFVLQTSTLDTALLPPPHLLGEFQGGFPMLSLSPLD